MVLLFFSVVSQLLAGGPEPSLPFLERLNYQKILPFSEIRPKGRGDVELGICDLPQQKVAYPILATRPDKQVGIWHVRRI